MTPSMHRRATKLGVATLSLLMANCLNLDGLAGEEKLPIPPNSGRLDASTSGSADAANSEVGKNEDASADAPRCFPNEGTFCATQCEAVFCSDFDGIEPFNRWPDWDLGNGVVVANTTDSSSLPSHALFQTPAASAESPRVAIKAPLPMLQGKSATVHYKFRFRVDSLGTLNNTGAVVGGLSVWGTDGGIDFHIYTGQGTTPGKLYAVIVFHSYIGGNEQQAFDLGSYNLHEWVDAEVDLTINDPTISTGHSASCSLNGQTSGEHPAVLPISNPIVQVVAGLPWVDVPAAPWAVRIDDAVVTISP